MESEISESDKYSEISESGKYSEISESDKYSEISESDKYSEISESSQYRECAHKSVGCSQIWGRSATPILRSYGVCTVVTCRPSIIFADN